MRSPALTLILLAPILLAIAVGAAPGTARAQMMGSGMMTPMLRTTPGYASEINPSDYPSPQERYEARIAALKARMQRLTAADGGQLTPEHKASLQKDLDSLNREFGVKRAPG